MRQTSRKLDVAAERRTSLARAVAEMPSDRYRSAPGDSGWPEIAMDEHADGNPPSSVKAWEPDAAVKAWEPDADTAE